MKTCILFVAVLFCGFCIGDYLTPVDCPGCVAQAPAINPHTDLRACEQAPLFIDRAGNQTEQRIERVETVRRPWFPGKNLIQRLRNR